MRAAILEGIEQAFIIKDIEKPIPGINESLVDVHYCSLNHRDYWISKGKYAGLKFPIVLGSDVSGYFNGNKVMLNPGAQWGDNQSFQSAKYEILGLPKNGGLAEFVQVDQSRIYEVPKHLRLDEAAALPLAGLTAFRALIQRAKAIQGEKVFISGIGGGVALFAMQFALALGCQVYVSSSSEDKLTKAIQMGAIAGINYTIPSWGKKFIEQYGYVDIVIDGAGGNDFAELVKITKPGGRIAFYGATKGSWERLMVQPLFWKQLTLLGSTMGSDRDFEEMLDLVSKYEIRPVVDRIFTLYQINDAIQYLSSGRQFGKIVIDTRN